MSIGIFCLENFWGKSVRDQSTIQPVLDLLQKQKMGDYLYHRCATRAELEFMLTRWRAKTNVAKSPILYFAFHGSKDAISVGNEHISLGEIATHLEGKCKGAVVFFDACETMKSDERNLKRFLITTGANAVLGYQCDVDWMKATAFGLLVLHALLPNRRKTTKDFEKLKDNLRMDSGQLYTDLQFRIVQHPELPERLSKK